MHNLKIAVVGSANIAVHVGISCNFNKK